MPESLKQNPTIGYLEVGTRKLKKITIYPLSVGQQFKVSDIISETLTNLFQQKLDDLDAKIAGFFIELVKKNLVTVIEFVTEPDELVLYGYKGAHALIDDLTNNQLLELCIIMKEQNFDDLVKNLKGPLMNLLKVFPQDEHSAMKGPSPESVISTQDTD